MPRACGCRRSPREGRDGCCPVPGCCHLVARPTRTTPVFEWSQAYVYAGAASNGPSLEEQDRGAERLFPPLGLARHGDEAHGEDVAAVEAAVLAPGQDDEVLEGPAHGDDQLAAHLELPEQRLGDLGGCGGDDDAVERGGVGPALVAVADAQVDVAVAQPGQRA